MSHHSDLIATNIDEYLAQHERKELLRFITCGSVDDGKSTLIGRLLYDSKMIYEDQLAAIEKASAVHGTTGGDFDPALLTDGLKAEREQGITIDVAYRYFSTAKRKFIIADTPGHVQYTRNMATGASTADLAIILIDARHGVLEQTKRHSFIVSLLGIKHILIAINKMDLVDFDPAVFERIRSAYKDFSARLDIPDLHFIPISALNGDNVVDSSDAMSWYNGPTLMGFLESVYIGSDRNLEDFRFPVQFVNRPHLDFRGFCGTIASGIVRQGDEVMVLPSRKTSHVKSIVTFEGEVEEAHAPLAVTLTLEDEIDCSRGDMIIRPGNSPRLEQKFEAMMVWMADDALVPGKQYLFKQTANLVTGRISQLRYQVDVNTLHRQETPSLKLNQIGRCSVQLDRPIAFDGYRRNRTTGAFIVIDRITNVTVGAGMIIDRATGEERHDHWDDVPEVQASDRNLSHLTEEEGQNLRLGISRDLGCGDEDRSENLRRASELAKVVNQSGLVCILAMVAPKEEIRQKAVEAIGRERTYVVHLECDAETCQKRDEEGHYAKNRPEVQYQSPESPDLVLETGNITIHQAAQKVVDFLKEKGVVPE